MSSINCFKNQIFGFYFLRKLFKMKIKMFSIINCNNNFNFFFRMGRAKTRLKAFRSNNKWRKMISRKDLSNFGIGLYANIDGFSEQKRLEISEMFNR